MCVATLGAIGAGISSVGAVGGGIAAGDAAKFQAQIAKNNQIVAQQNAAAAAQATATNTETAGLKARATLANVRAGEAANGLDINTGSPALVQTGTREIGGLNQAEVSRQGALQTYGYEAQATSFGTQAALDEQQATLDPIAGAISGAGGLLENSQFDSLVGSSGSGTGGASEIGGSPAGQFSTILNGGPSLPSNYSWMTSANPEPAFN